MHAPFPWKLEASGRSFVAQDHHRGCSAAGLESRLASSGPLESASAFDAGMKLNMEISVENLNPNWIYVAEIAPWPRCTIASDQVQCVFAENHLASIEHQWVLLRAMVEAMKDRWGSSSSDRRRNAITLPPLSPPAARHRGRAQRELFDVCDVRHHQPGVA